MKGNKRVIKGGKRVMKGSNRKLKEQRGYNESMFLESYHHKNISLSSLKSYQKIAKNNPAKGVAHKTPKFSQPFTII